MTENYETDDIRVVADPVAETGPRVLPILPATELVLFPRLIMPLALWEEPAQKLVDEVLLQDKTLGFLTSREEKPTGFDPENFYQRRHRRGHPEDAQGRRRLRASAHPGTVPVPGGQVDGPGPLTWWPR